jgi:hypothetical protein
VSNAKTAYECATMLFKHTCWRIRVTGNCRLTSHFK